MDVTTSTETVGLVRGAMHARWKEARARLSPPPKPEKVAAIPKQRTIAEVDAEARVLRGRLNELRLERLAINGGCPTIEAIQDAVMDYFGISRNKFLSDRRTTPVVFPRHVAMFLCTELTTISYPGIGRMFGGMDHTTIMHAAKKIDVLYRTDKEVQTDIDTLMSMLLASTKPTEDAPCSSPPTTAQ
jgi:chromosomal replication initiation ATPase DnaA